MEHVKKKVEAGTVTGNTQVERDKVITSQRYLLLKLCNRIQKKWDDDGHTSPRGESVELRSAILL